MNLKQMAANTLLVGSVSTVTTTVAAIMGGLIDAGKGLAPLNAISHIAWGGDPPAHGGKWQINSWMGLLLHAGASVFWAAMFESFFGRYARQTPGRISAASAATAAAAYITDYYVVSKRFRPGYEAYLSRKSMFGVYAALAAGIALGAALTRFDHHKIKDR
jgi:hypothetical protein